jgi:hypothetical protein
MPHPPHYILAGFDHISILPFVYYKLLTCVLRTLYALTRRSPSPPRVLDLLSQQHFVLRLIRRALSVVFFYCALVVHTFGRRYYDRTASSGGTLIIWPTQSLEGYVTSPPFVHSDVIVNGALCCARLHLPRETNKQTNKRATATKKPTHAQCSFSALVLLLLFPRACA